MIDRVLGRGEWVATCDREENRGLRRRLRLLCEEAIQQPSLVEYTSFRQELEVEIPASILKALEASSGNGGFHMPHSSVRNIAVDRARSFIEQNPFEPITVQELSQVTRVSWRTLDYAFREQYGVSPKGYLKAVRLNGVRKELVQARPDEKVADLANKWGFWHMGQFAADYRKMFGELPSKTLDRSMTS